MPQVNLSTLTGRELRQLLDASRRRGDAALSYQILQEMAARREGGVTRGPFLMRRPAGPHLVAVELDDPVEADELPPLPKWRPPTREPAASASPPQEHEVTADPAPRQSRRKTPPARTMASAAAVPVAPVEVEPLPPPKADLPLSTRDADLERPQEEAADAKDQDLRLHPVGLENTRAARQPRLQVVAAFALGITVGTAAGAALGWWMSGIARDSLSPPPAAGTAPFRTAALAPRPAPAPAPLPLSAAEPAPEALPDAAVGPTPDLPAGPASPPNAPALAADADSRTIGPPPPAPPPAPRNPEPASAAEMAQPPLDRPAPAMAKSCAAEPTPADRTICGAPELRRLQRELQRAYAEALEAHEDRALLRQRQLAWRNARNTVADPDRLALLYEQRIRKLQAATAAARQAR